MSNYVVLARFNDEKEMQKMMELVFSQDVFGEAVLTALEVYTYPKRLIKRFDLK